MIRKIFFIAFGLILHFSDLVCQKEFAKWLFKSDVIIDFESGNPVQKKLNAQLEFARDGFSVVCDKEGRLLFYTDGDFVFDRLSRKLPSSEGFNKLDFNALYKGIVVKSSEQDSFYYIVSHYRDKLNGNHIIKSELKLTGIDLTKNKSFGDIVFSNKIADGIQYSFNSIMAFPHPCHGIWLFAHNQLNKAIEIIHIIEGKIVYKSTYAIDFQFIDDSYPSVNFLYSKQLNKLISGTDINVMMFDFDEYSGKISNSSIILEKQGNFRGALSPDGTKLYHRAGDAYNVWIVQYDLSSGNSTIIRNSKSEFRFPYPTTYFGIGGNSSYHSFGLGIDGKLYMASPGIRYNLPRINHPDKLGLACDFDPFGLSLDPQIYSFTIPEPLVFSTPDIKNFLPQDTTFCKVPSLTISPIVPYDSLRWHNGTRMPSINVNAPGIYGLTLYKNGCEYHDTMTIAEIPTRTLNLGPDRTLCKSESHTFTIPTQSGDQIRWEDGSTAAQRLLSTPGRYVATINTRDGCSISDTIDVLRSYQKVPKSGTISLCEGETYTYKGRSYSAGQTITDSIPAVIGCDTLLTMTINQKSTPSIYTDTTTCSNGLITIQGKNYTPGDTITKRKSSSTGCDTIHHTVYNRYDRPIPSVIRQDTVLLCPGATTTVTTSAGYTLRWSNGATTQAITVTSGKYAVTTTDSKGCIHEVPFEIKAAPSISYIKEAQNPTCLQNNGSIRIVNTNSQNDFKVKVNDSPIIGKSIDNLAPGKYVITLSDQQGCFKKDSVTLAIDQNLMVTLPPDVTIEKGKQISIPYQSNTKIDTILFLPDIDAYAKSDTIYIKGIEDRTYTITFATKDGCRVVKTLFTDVQIKESSIVMPNIVKLHSSDPENTLFYVKTEGISYDIAIYDRWGNLIHDGKTLRGNDKESAWIPSARGITSGVYVYIISIHTDDGVKLSYGTVTVL